MNDPVVNKIRLAIDRLGAEYPLHAGILAQWNLEKSATVQTMGVGFAGNRLRLIYSADFVESINLEELTGVLHHEVNHVVFEHCLHEPEEKEDGCARTIAEEVTANEWVPEPLPGAPVLLAQYPFLPANESTDKRYRRLCKRQSSAKPGGSRSRSAKPSLAVAGGGAGQGCIAQPGACPACNGVPTVDDHATWSEIRKDKAVVARAAKMDIAIAMGNLNERQREKVSKPFAGIAQAAAKASGFEPGVGIGTDPGNEEEHIEEGEGRVPWQVVLRRHIGKTMQRRPVFGRPPRRFPHLVGVVPGKARYAQRPTVMAAIDTSGSMSADMLGAISAELELMARCYEVLVVECDTSIRRVYPFKPIKSVMGRGGTDLCPPLEVEFLRKHQPDVVVYFTDGFGPAPEKPPAIPVIWGITEAGEKPVTWGTEIHLSEPKISTFEPNFSTETDILEARSRRSDLQPTAGHQQQAAQPHKLPRN